MSLIFWLVVLFILLLIYVIKIYNNLQRSGQHAKSANANVLTVIQKRVDMLNQLIDIAKEYGQHEKLLHISVSNNMKEMVVKSEQAKMVINSLSMSYPELKANATYQQLMSSLENIESQLQEKRESYNHAAEAYNSMRIVFPTNLIANSLGFQEAPYFDFDNLDKIKEFKTDDGQLLKELLGKVSAKTTELSRSGVNKTLNVIKTEEQKIDNSKNDG